jgi:hypothetical protein
MMMVVTMMEERQEESERIGENGQGEKSNMCT